MPELSTLPAYLLDVARGVWRGFTDALAWPLVAWRARRRPRVPVTVPRRQP
jgi:hypothetical protein